MKKQFFTFVVMLAIVVLAGRSAMAQTAGSGITPSTAKELIVGAAATFTVADANTSGEGTATSYTWTVLAGSASGAEAQAGSATVQGTNWQFVNSLTDHTTVTPAAAATSVNIKFLTTPVVAVAGSDIYIVQVTSASSASCRTVRRFYISVFDFSVRVFLVASDISTEVSTNTTACNSWDQAVVHNYDGTAEYEGSDLTAYAPTDVDNTTNNRPKYTTEYFGVQITLTGAASTNLNTLKWRLQYNLIDGTEASASATANVDADLQLYQINSLATTNTPLFAGESGSATIQNATGALAISTVSTYADNNTIYFPARTDGTGASTHTYYFSVNTHNILSADAMSWGIQATKVQIETSPTTQSNYDNGSKVQTSVAVTNDIVLTAADARSAIYTITQTPATSVIDIAD